MTYVVLYWYHTGTVPHVWGTYDEEEKANEAFEECYKNPQAAEVVLYRICGSRGRIF